jgi:hypothetical protein
MRRVFASALLLVSAFCGGCGSSAKYIEKRGDTGVVAIPANTDVWPSYNRRAALELIQKHVGVNYEILEEREVVTGQSTTNNQQTNIEQTVNREIFFLPAEKQTTTTTTTSRDLTEWRIVYRRVPTLPASGPPLLPIGGAVPAAGQAPAGVVPSVQPAAATTPAPAARGMSHFMGTPKPAGPKAGDDCDH